MSITRIKSYGISDGAITTNKISGDVSLGVKIANVQIANSSYGIIDDTAIALEGGYLVINGAGFASGCQVIVGANTATSTTFVNSTTIRAQVGAADAGTKTIYVVNTDGGTAIRVNGLTYSATPTWVTGSTLTEGAVDEAISIQLSASGATSYQVQTGSTLPTGLSLAGNGLLSGTVTGIEADTTYSFTIEAIDDENQESPRSFSISITFGDEYFYATTLLLNGDGANGANNNVFVDSSNNNFSITRNGNVTQGTFSPFSAPDGRWSNHFDGTGDYLTTPANSAFVFGTGDFTIECWAYRTASSASYQAIVTNWTTGWWFGFNNNTFTLLKSGGGSVITDTGTSPLNSWDHYCVSRSGSTVRMFVNGILKNTVTDANNFTGNNNIFIGSTDASNHFFTGSISNLRIVKGTAVYTSNFTPSTSPLTAITNTSLLTCQSNRFKDNSTTNSTLTPNGNVSVTSFATFAPTAAYSAATNGGSGYFDGTGDYLEMPSNSVDLQDSNFCIEIWCYPTRIDQNAFMMVGDADGSSTPGSSWYMSADSSRGSRIHIGNTGYTVSTVPSLNSWNHICMIRSGSTLYGFVNGVLSQSVSVSGTVNDGSTNLKPGIGTAVYASVRGVWQGWLSDARVTVGSTVYNTAGFTPPTAPLTAISNTVFLCNFTNAGILDYTAKNNLETVGTAQINTAEKKYGTGSIILSPGGGSHYTRVPLTESLKFGTGDFTIECWIYLITNPAGICAVWSNYSGFSAGSLSLFAGHYSSSANHFIIAHNGGFPALSSTTTVNSRLGLWTHLAVVRSSGQIKLYVNGVSEGTPFASTVALDGVGSYFWVGTTGDSTSANPNCYIDDFRITKGIARYTSNFTPPTSAHKLK